MSAFVKFEKFVEDLASKVHDLRAAGDTLKVLLSNTAPDAAANAVKADITEIAAGNGYTAGGLDVQNAISRAGGVLSLTGVDVTITAAGGDIGPFRYAVLYNDTPATKPLIGYWDRGDSITLHAGEDVLVDVDPGGSDVILTLT